MKQNNAWLKNLVMAIILCGFAFNFGCNHVEKPLESKALNAPLITEISPQKSGKDFPWIELYNPGTKKVDVAGLVISINDDYKYMVPEKMPAMPPQSYLVLAFDNKGKASDSYDFKNGVAVLHAESDLTKAIQHRAGQVAIYKKNKQAKEELLDFVAWGAPGTLKSLTPERNRIWKKKWFVPQMKTFGDYSESGLKEVKDFSIARYPGSYGHDISDWVVLYGKQRTLGAKNNIPGIGMFTLAGNATVRSEDIAVGWVTNKFAKEYKFQIASDSLFQNIVEDLTLTKPLYKPSSTLPEGVYFYRVKVIDAKGLASEWSKTMRVVSKKMKGEPNGRNEDGAIVEEVLLTDMQHKYQKKDTRLLCLDGCASNLDGSTVKHWDNVHPEAGPSYGDHGDMNCVRASISMMVSYYGGKSLSQDRIAYFTEEERTGVGNGIPEGDLAHSVGMSYSAEETAALEWALDETITDFFDSPNPSFNDLKGWLDSDRPIMTRTPGHLRTMNGYRVEDDGTQWVHILDPWSGPRWETYTTWNGAARGTWVGPVSAPNAREDEPEVWTDADGDNVMDFDELNRFAIGMLDSDSDNDGVNDKEDIYEYVYQMTDVYSKRTADFDADGVRKEKDPDNDADSFSDGCEDKNGNGIYESTLGETNNFAVNVDVVCPTKPIHAIMVFDRSGSMAGPSSDPKYDRAADAATLFLDTWLANDPPALTKVGLVYYDHAAYFDTDASTSTVLDVLDVSKRDKIVTSFPGNAPSYGSTSIGGGILKAMEPQGFDTASVSAGNQHRVILVLTDGKENSGVRMNDTQVTQALVNGKVDGYVLGIGDETQISVEKLNTLAGILNHPPASFANDLDAFELEKFFLQVLAETQGMEFNLDPVEQMAVGTTKSHTVPVNPGAERVTFVVVWNEANGKIDFTLKDPNGQAVAADVVKIHDRYQVSSKANPKAGQWRLELAASSTGSPAPSVIHYSVMALEKNTSVSGLFAIQGVQFLTGDNIRLIATLSSKNEPIVGGKVQVKVERPETSLGTFVSKTRVRIPDRLKVLEKNVKVSALDKKYQVMAEKKIAQPKITETLELRDDGKMGDEIPGDGKYTGIFKQTKNDGIYKFRFLASKGESDKTSALNREKVYTMYVKPRIRAQISELNVVERKYLVREKSTYLKLNITPKDRFGNLIGPGRTDMLKLDLKKSEIVNIKDNLDGSYEVELKVPGNYKAIPGLISVSRSTDLKGLKMMK